MAMNAWSEEVPTVKSASFPLDRKTQRELAASAARALAAYEAQNSDDDGFDAILCTPDTKTSATLGEYAELWNVPLEKMERSLQAFLEPSTPDEDTLAQFYSELITIAFNYKHIGDLSTEQFVDVLCAMKDVSDLRELHEDYAREAMILADREPTGIINFKEFAILFNKFEAL
mmetsp:Transcript_77134/g.136111  ORF Transcript_77134/g.136111 Transcript_77134/m.136111 type:complete len:173 (-) Transcript_77134:94-612(-)|eukprot:CAMPEP_0197664418 /NCGR_PEP_ID=MMETSP1338-20131121/58621_1 /TAXON_ID=43686 ORGANISM="Pelagodinium beii, Strain RCC1491" /NCGR_SAMPLE_ID=MMETSP1338 /ASSEMBLY_ACC=CAM_ASM_000754 /LENGTH=172 /DNA_ID=CAMNT_0043243047 /DNA_START=57 /DNA_END=575 /DNA_ORIENTATION=+